MGEAQLQRGATFRTQLLQYAAEPQDPLCRIQLSVKRRQRLKLLVCRCLIDVDATRLTTLEYRMLLHQVVRHCVEVVDGIANRILVVDP
jgi:hypothetical protein